MTAAQVNRRALHGLGRCWDAELVDLGEVVTEYLEHATLALGLLLQFIEVLRDQVANRIGRLELQGQHPLGRRSPSALGARYGVAWS